jgi:hypothetical protein
MTDHIYPPPSPRLGQVVQINAPASSSSHAGPASVPPGQVPDTSYLDLEAVNTELIARRISSTKCCRAYTAVIITIIPTVILLAYATGWSSSLIDLAEKARKLFAKGSE